MLRSRAHEGTAALSGFTQSAGYLIATPGPFLIGMLYDATGNWTAPLLALTALTVLLALVARVVARPTYIEDQFAVSAIATCPARTALRLGQCPDNWRNLATPLKNAAVSEQAGRPVTPRRAASGERRKIPDLQRHCFTHTTCSPPATY